MAQLHRQKGLGLEVESLDAEHQRLVDLINRLHDLMQGDKDRAVIGTALDDLAHYAGYHFGREERAMREQGESKHQAHHKLHHELEERLRMFRDAFHCSADSFEFGDFSEFLSDWLLVHVLCEDVRNAPHRATSRTIPTPVPDHPGFGSDRP